jgi:predicted membrane-bound spermidine synthase
MSFWAALAVVTLSGYVALSCEIIWYRAYAFVSGDSPSVFGLLLGAYLAGLATGALVAGRVCRASRSLGPRGAISLAAFIAIANVLSFLVVPGLAHWVLRFPWTSALALVAVAASALGAILPLVSHLAISPDQQAGARVSVLYLGNIVGSASGSLLTGLFLMDQLSIGPIALIQLLLGLLVALLVLASARTGGRVLALGALAVAIAASTAVMAAPALFDAVYERLLEKGRFSPDRRFSMLIENRHGVIAAGRADDGHTIVFGSGVYDGKVSLDLVRDVNGIVRPYALAGMHPSPRRVLVVGVASGAWTQVLAHLPQLEELVAIEINSGYLALIRAHGEVSSLLANPKVKLIIDDGRRWMNRHPGERFDLIVQNTTVHWRSHSTLLLSREYLALARDHLRPGGLLMYNTTDSRDAILTGLQVFAHGMTVANAMVVSDHPFDLDQRRWTQILAGYQIDGRPVFDPRVQAHRRRLEELGSAAWRTRVLRQGSELRRHVAGARVISDDNMLPEWHPGRWRPEP